MADERPPGIDLKVTDRTIQMVRIGAGALLAALASPLIAAFAERTTALLIGLLAVNVTLFGLGLWATRICFHARGHRRATWPVGAVILTLAIAVGALAWSVLVVSSGVWLRNWLVGSIWIWAILLPALGGQLAVIVFGARAIGFARYGGAMWTAIGVLHILVAVSLFSLGLMVLAAGPLGMARGNFGMVSAAGLFALIAILVYPAALICHAIGLYRGAGQLEALRALGTAFE